MRALQIPASIIGILVLSIGCGPARYPAPEVKDIGARPESAPVAEPARPPRPGPAAPPRVPAPAPTPAPAVPQAPIDTAAELEFLDVFAAQLAAVANRDPGPVAVLPALHINQLFHRFEVGRLGEDLAQEVHQRLRGQLDAKAILLSPLQFQRELESSNRTLADLDSPSSALQLAGRIGVRYLALGFIGDSPGEMIIQYEGFDVLDGSPIASSRRVFRPEEGAALGLYRRFRDPAGQPIAGGIKIGALAEGPKPSLQAELQWIIAGALQRMIAESAADLRDAPIGVLPASVPSEIRFQRYQEALRREILKEKNRLMALGLDESRARSQGPVRILGQTFANLRAAEDYASEKDLDQKLSTTGELQFTLSRIVFDRLEDLGEKAGLDVIPHDQIINEVKAFSREEMDRIEEGILPPATKELFRTKGARALLFNELLEAGDGFELVFDFRRMDNLKRIGSRQRAILEPRFALELRQFMRKSDGSGN